MKRTLLFRDPRPPQTIQSALERDLSAPLRLQQEGGQLLYRSEVELHGAQYHFELRFEAAFPLTCAYAFKATASRSLTPSETPESFEKQFKGWFDFWTRNFSQASSMDLTGNSAEQYRALAEKAVATDKRLSTVEAVQQEILTAMRAGGTFSTAHKEGGTLFSYCRGKFLRTDYGDSPGGSSFGSEASFLKALRKFYDWEVTQHSHPAPPAELDAWKLILRKLDSPLDSNSSAAARAALAFQSLTRLKMLFATAAFLVVAALAALFGLRNFFHQSTAVGTPFGQSVRTPDYVATLIESQATDFSLGRHRPENARYDLGLLLHPLQSPDAPRYISIAKRLQLFEYRNHARILGQDGPILWFLAPKNIGLRLASNTLISEEELAQSIPIVRDLLQQGIIEFDGKLQLSSRDARSSFEVDAASMRAQAVPNKKRYGLPSSASRLEDSLCSGGWVSPDRFLCLASDSELTSRYRTGFVPPKEFYPEISRVSRHLYMGQIETNDSVPTIARMTRLSDQTFTFAGFVRESAKGKLLRLSGPERVILAESGPSARTQPTVLHGMSPDGKILWTVDSKLTQLQQILPSPDQHRELLALTGARDTAPGKLPEPLLVFVSLTNGMASPRSLETRGHLPVNFKR